MEEQYTAPVPLSTLLTIEHACYWVEILNLEAHCDMYIYWKQSHISLVITSCSLSSLPVFSTWADCVTYQNALLPLFKSILF